MRQELAGGHRTRMAVAIRGTLFLALAAMVAVVPAGCAESALATESPLSDARVSPEALAEDALAALYAQDDSTLRAMLVTREEYEGMMWPEMPDREYTPFEFVWGMQAPRTRKALRNQLSDHEGIEFELVRVDLGPEEEIERYPSFTLYPNARMYVRRTDTGAEGRIPLMDALVEMGGGWKFMNFRDDS